MTRATLAWATEARATLAWATEGRATGTWNAERAARGWSSESGATLRRPAEAGSGRSNQIVAAEAGVLVHGPTESGPAESGLTRRRDPKARTPLDDPVFVVDFVVLRRLRARCR